MTTSKPKGNVDSSFRNLIHFIPAGRNCQEDQEKVKQKLGHSRKVERSGKEARAFYENLLSEENAQTSSTLSGLTTGRQIPSPSGKSNEKRSRNKRKRQASHFKSSQAHVAAGEENGHEKEFFNSQTLDSNQRQHFKLLQSAQLGCDQEVEDLLRSGLNVNFQDFLLEMGAERSLQNSTGDNAWSLARNAGHSNVSDMIKRFKHRHKSEESESSSLEGEGMFYCESCKQEFAVKEKKSHYSSTVHLFNSNKKKSLPAFLIPETNRGFQMLLRSGWTGDKGLGPDGEGVKYPVKTILKQDRKGLGGDEDNRKKAKVTHFSAKDERAIQHTNVTTRRDLSVRTLARKAQKLKEKRERRWETNLRYELQ